MGTVAVSSSGTLALYNTNTSVDNSNGGLLNGTFTGSGTIDKTGAGYIDLWGWRPGASIQNFAGTINVQQGTIATNGSVGTTASSAATTTSF